MRLRAERKAGEILRQREKAHGKRADLLPAAQEVDDDRPPDIIGSRYHLPSIIGLAETGRYPAGTITTRCVERCRRAAAADERAKGAAELGTNRGTTPSIERSASTLDDLGMTEKPTTSIIATRTAG
jgi:hypothetical protein